MKRATNNVLGIVGKGAYAVVELRPRANRSHLSPHCILYPVVIVDGIWQWDETRGIIMGIPGEDKLDLITRALATRDGTAVQLLDQHGNVR